MTTEETELTFVRCPSCRSLIPAIATRCRMCGAQFEKGGEAQSDSNQDQSDPSRKSRVRQRTISATPEEVDQIKREATGAAQPSREQFRFGSSSAAEQHPPRSVPPVPDPEPEDDLFAGPFGPEDDDDSLADTGVFSKKTAAEMESESNSHPFESVEQHGAEEPAAADEDWSDDAESEGFDDDDADEDDGHDAAPPSSSRPEGAKKRRRRRRRKRGHGPAGETAAAADSPRSESEPEFETAMMPPREVPPPVSPAAVAAPSNGMLSSTVPPNTARSVPQEQPSAAAPASRNENAVRHDFAPRGEERRIGAVPVSEPAPQREIPVHQETAPVRQETAPSRAEAAPVRRDAPPLAAPTAGGERDVSVQALQEAVRSQGDLVGWLVNFSTNAQGAGIEIRGGRFFVGRQNVRGHDLLIPDQSISTPHCMVTASKSDGLLIQDLMSEGGTYVKRKGTDSYVRIHHAVSVEHGDWLKIGEYEVLVCFVP
jgi:hypothetical protein